MEEAFVPLKIYLNANIQVLKSLEKVVEIEQILISPQTTFQILKVKLIFSIGKAILL